MQYSPVIGIPEPCQRATGLLIMPTVGYNAHCFLCNREILKYNGQILEWDQPFGITSHHRRSLPNQVPNNSTKQEIVTFQYCKLKLSYSMSWVI